MSKSAPSDLPVRPEQLSFSSFVRSDEPPPFVTVQQQFFTLTNSFKPYWRLHDPICSRVLRQGLNPRRFEWKRTIFPLFREASLFQFPRSAQVLAAWLPFAFFAGWEFGRKSPEKGAALLQDRRAHSVEPIAILRALGSLLGPLEANPWNLYAAFEQLVAKSGFNPKNVLEIIPWLADDTFAAGLAAATVAKSDPDLCGLLARIEPRVNALRTQLHVRALFHSCVEGQSVWERLRHPLLKVAAEQYPRTPTEKAAILPFFHEQLRALGIRSEDDCPADDRALVVWVERAWRYGRRLRHHEPERVRQVIEELGPSEYGAIVDVAQEVLDRAGSRRPAVLIKAILEWHLALYRYSQPRYYGQALDRIARCADFAIWAALAGLKPRRPNTGGQPNK